MRKPKEQGETKPEAGEEKEPTSEAAEETSTVETPVVAEEEAPVVEEPEPEEEEALPEPEAEAPSSPAQKKMYLIIIDEQDNSDKNNAIFVTDPSDGTPFSIQRGFEVEVPEGVVNNLKESIITRMEKDGNGDDKLRNIPRFAMRIIKGPY